MIPIQDELLHLLEQMDEQQNHLLNMARKMVQPPRHYTARELMALHAEERERLVAQAIAQAADEDFEMFETLFRRLIAGRHITLTGPIKHAIP